MAPEDIEQLADAVAEKVAARLGAQAPLLSTRQVAERLGLSERTVRDLIASGALASLKVEGARRVESAAVEAYVAARRGET